MAARPRIRPVAALAALALAGLLAGCGSTFKLPTEDRTARVLPGQGTYQRIATWTPERYANLAYVKDILLTPSGELFVVMQNEAAGTGEVRRFPQSNPVPMSTSFPGLVNPTAICFGANRLFVLDQGDTASARTTLNTVDGCQYRVESNADVDTTVLPLYKFRRPITDLARYWRVREYLLDGTPVASFTDTSFAFVTGIAADAAGRVYVSGTILYCRIDPFDPLKRSLEYRSRVRCYAPGAPDARYWHSMAGDPWHKVVGFALLEGTGFGSTRNPQGMQWANPLPLGSTGPVGPALYFADMGNDQVQKYADPAGFATSFKLDIGGSGADSVFLSAPVDVAVDSAGCVYLVDAGNLRVLRYDPDGRFIQRVDRNPDDPASMQLVRPSAVAADNRQVYIADRGAGQVLRYWRRD